MTKKQVQSAVQYRNRLMTADILRGLASASFSQECSLEEVGMLAELFGKGLQVKRTDFETESALAVILEAVKDLNN